LIIGNFHFRRYFNRKKKPKHRRSYRQGKRAKKIIFLRELYQRTYSVCISNGKSLTDWPSVLVAWAVNISELSVQYRQIYPSVISTVNTTPLTSFTDGLIPSVTTMKSVGEIITDGITDGTRPSVYQSSVTPLFVAKSVANKKKHPPTEHRRSYRRIRTRQKKVSRGNITDGINPSASSTVITDGNSVGNYGMAGNCFASLCEIPTDIIRR